MADPALSACFDPTTDRSADRYIESALGIKSWMERTPTCAEARPGMCPCCGAAGQPLGGPLGVVGHGVRARQVLGPLSFGGAPELLVVALRRYRCRACEAVLVVGPRGLVRGRWYSGAAIAGALAALASGETSAAVRRRTSPAPKVGASAVERWVTVERWVEAARRGALFAIRGLGELSPRRVAEQVTLVLAARGGHTPGAELGASAFAGAAVAACSSTPAGRAEQPARPRAPSAPSSPGAPEAMGSARRRPPARAIHHGGSGTRGERAGNRSLAGDEKPAKETSMEPLSPRDHGEQVAVFRYGLLGPLVTAQLDHGELAAELRRLSQQRVRPPGSDTTRTYSTPTLERWLYAYKKGGLGALAPRARTDRGRGRDLDPAVRELLCDIRRECPDVSVPLIVRTLRVEGRIGPEVTACTVRRMFAEKGLHRGAAADGKGEKARLRWQAARPGALWHGDVCHGPTLTLDGRRTPVRVHALLDDASRYVVALRVASDEREETMLALLAQALMEHGKPDALYLDNGATYRGAVLQLACGRLGISLLHAKPYDASARGKMERFWRRMREEALDHLGHVASLADVESRLRTWLGRFYQGSPHAGLLGRAPATVFSEGDKVLVSQDELRAALTVRSRRRVRRDSIISVDGTEYEVPLGYLAGQLVTVATSFFDGAPPVLELDGKRIGLHPVDPVGNGHRRRPPRRPVPDKPARPVDFDPGKTLVLPELSTSAQQEEVDDESVF